MKILELLNKSMKEEMSSLKIDLKKSKDSNGNLEDCKAANYEDLCGKLKTLKEESHQNIMQSILIAEGV